MTNLKATLQKNYYGKAKTRTENNATILKSYNTDVLKIENGKIVKLWSGYSKTTMQHINDFLLQNGFTPLNKKQWLDLPCENEKPCYKVAMSNGFFTHYGTALLTDDEIDGEIERIEKNNPRLTAWAE
mgnify:CR=1 FL=1